MSRLRDGLPRNGDPRPHFVVCGADALVYTVAEELANAGHRIRLTVIVPPDLRSDVPDLGTLRGIRVVRAERLDERTFRAAGLADAAALALVMPDDVVNLHAALCAQAVEPDLRLVIRMFNSGLGYGVRRLFEDSAVLSDAAMAAPAFVAAALGEVAPTHVRLPGRTVYVARRADVQPEHVICSLTAADGAGRVDVLPAEPAAEAQQPEDLVLAEATGRPAGQTLAAQRLVRARKRRRHPLATFGRAVRAALNRKLGIAVVITLVVTAISGTVLAHAAEVHGFWKSIYVTLLTAVGSSDVEENRNAVAQAAQLVLTIAGLALLPLITAAVVEGMVNARLALARGAVPNDRADHIVVVGLGSVGTRVLRQLVDLGLEVVAIDRRADARGAKVAEQLGVPLIVGDASLEETLRAASVATSKALVVVSTDDVTNLQAALNARAARPGLRVVLRLFDDDFARRVEDAFNIDISRSVSRLAAPAFVAAMLERDVLATIPVDRHALLVAAVRVLGGAPLDGAPLSRVDRALSVRVIGLSAAGAEWVDWAPDPRRVLGAGDRIFVVARRAGLRALVEQATPPAESLLVERAETPGEGRDQRP
ncbi:potassium transporter TrkA [Actinoplanes sp. NBRC 14428]|uniref:Trk K+ transport system NAD-binding subunit n=1 Tax=Pseudosporangium ferrugineum TaxID=439699 RepID=A0A2T0S5Y2_9ACTN|nr:Trk K+ transport system NAD-binding subunit [Pseudosporangium ferrugineum]BCJ53715.1 potassium transporter TrkA [Actinoplanes sp. NBRC 14428]